MQTLTQLLTAATLVFGATATLAMEPSPTHLDLCEADLRDFYGEDVAVQLVKQRRYPDGVRMTVAAKLDQDNASFATCWVAHADLAPEARSGAEMFAVTQPPAPKP